MSRKALLAGATGLTGEALLTRLLADRSWSQVCVVGRRAPARTARSLSHVATDFTKLEGLGDALAADDVFCCLGTTLRRAGSQAAFERVDYHMVVDLARAARQAGARRFIVVSAVGASLKSPAFYSRVKARMEQAVGDLSFEAVHVLRPSLLLGPRSERRPAERAAQLVSPLIAPFMVGPLAKYRPVRAEAVAEAMVQLALHGAPGVHVHHLPLAAGLGAGG
ncbi:MAG TPA: NAD(P)H-binding protein [Candidatus Binatia bacterium]|nr:NAD(P)H-binding protein [Candidatus Binatia bacterium]